ncbi:putative mediator of RNA polymerase II transcription subunit 26 [Homarus americanus]|nr:putative mediator of RNA polymerase II transcription subunit 26 [Homarus americanus]XP_042227822.1 putative mediator of RNA polymerase II transcription subunit 26 [Homarus americanus]XP_042227823.1 putative mediator of RNA polymerase II transcription subunit 26 [Homarus americanus]XP_042227824.1 putative mediator of RNA polymerase II transcription subunit 26 [Homarus americanus]
MNFPEVRSVGGSVGGGVGIGAGSLGCTSAGGDSNLTVTSPASPPPETAAYMGFQTTSPLSSPQASYPPVSRPSIASMWGIGGFTTPPMPPPPVVCPNTIASTLGIPQMPSATYFNSRAPMGFNFRMAGSHLNGIPFVFKRKPEEEPEAVKPVAKQHISEERMAAHLNSLHLSESFYNHRLGKKSCSDVNDMVLEDEADEGLGEDDISRPWKSRSKGPACLVIADEVKQIIPGESQLPASLLKKLTKPSMEVVLWQPPGNIIRNIIKPSIPTEIEVVESKNSSSDSLVNPPNSTSTGETSTSSSPDSGISVSSPPPSLSFLRQNSTASSSSSSSQSSSASSSSSLSSSSLISSSSSSSLGTGIAASSSDVNDDLLSLPSTSSGSRGGYLPSLRRPASPLPDPMADDDFSERMEFNNNNNNAPNFMWLEENNNTALLDLNAVEPPRTPQLEDLPDLPDSDDMDL